MTLPRETVLELMAFADGELDGEARARAERLVEANEEARRVVEGMRSPALGLWLNEAIAARAHIARTEDIASTVLARIAAAPRPVAKVRSAGRWWATGTVGLVAMAAAVALYAYGSRARSLSEGRSARAPQPTRAVAPERTSSTQDDSLAVADAVEVDEIDSPARPIAVYEIPGAARGSTGGVVASSVVIWIDDQPGGP